MNSQRRLYYLIDHTSKWHGNTGVQRVVRGLARSLVGMGERVTFVCWDEDKMSFVLANRSQLEHLSKWGGPDLTAQFFELYPAEGAVMIHEAGVSPLEGDWLIVPEVTHITYHCSPQTLNILGFAKSSGMKTAFIFYDAIPLKRVEYRSDEEVHASYMRQIYLADLIVPISRYCANDLQSFFMNELNSDSSTMPRIEPLLLPVEMTDNPLARKHSPRSAEVMALCVGTVEPRKNQIGLIKAFQRICEHRPQAPIRLVIVGHLHEAIAKSFLKGVGENPKIEYLKYVDEDTLRDLYSDCAFTVFPSVEEGYGLPIAESLWHGKPCLCANFGSMAEVAEGGGCFMVDTRSVEELQKGLEALFFNMDMRSRLEGELKRRCFTTWMDYTKEFLCALDWTQSRSDIGRIYYWVDSTVAMPFNTGIQRVTRGLAKTLLELRAVLTPVKWDEAKKGFVSPSDEELVHFSKWNGPATDRWDLRGIGNVGKEKGGWLIVPELTTYSDKIDLSDVVRVAREHGMKTGVVFYDAIPHKMKDSFPAFYNAVASAHHERYMSSLPNFDIVFCISDNAMRDLLSFLETHRSAIVASLTEKIVSIPLPCGFEDSQKAHSDPSDDVITVLSVGTLEPRKNHGMLVRAFVRAMGKSSVKMRLIIAGRECVNDITCDIKSFCERYPEIQWIKSPNDEMLHEFYRRCHFTVFPSMYEGFGLPILESLWHGRPCICRNTGVMADVAGGGGCLLVETADEEALSEAIARLAQDERLRKSLGEEALHREFKTWNQYGEEVLNRLADVGRKINVSMHDSSTARGIFRSPLLSICITTYNRAEWLAVSLALVMRLTEPYRDIIEVVVCDNASTDTTPDIVVPYIGQHNFRYYRNRNNVGMLGNLRVTADHAKGQYVWILGDDDLLREKTIERVMLAILENPGVGLVYLNYAYTRVSEARLVTDVDAFLNSGTPIVPECANHYGKVKEISTFSENFFTAIYCLVFRRDHAIRAYSQNTAGRPFSTLLTCIPTSFYVCNYMFEEDGYWIGEPSVVVNMNVSWGKYAPLWILERIPELYDLAEKKGADPGKVDKWRVHNLPGILHFLEKIYFEDKEDNIRYFSIERLFMRHKHLPEFNAQVGKIAEIYARAHRSRVPGAEVPFKQLMKSFAF